MADSTAVDPVGGRGARRGPLVARPRRATLQWLAGLRALVAVALFAPLAAFAAGQGDLSRAAWFAMLPVLPLLTSAVALWRLDRETPAGLFAQIATDALVVLAVVWSTGGLISAYTPLMLLPVLTASVTGGRHDGLRAAAVIGIGFVLMATMQYGWLPSPSILQSRAGRSLLPGGALAGYTVAANLGGSVAIALLIGHLSETLTRTGADLARATSSLADLTTLSQRVIDSMAGGLIVTDAQGHVVLFNRTAENITGRRADDVLGYPMSRVLVLPVAVDSGSFAPVRLECTFTRVDGTVIELGATTAPLLAEGGQRAGELVTFQDLTLINQRDAEKQRQERLAAVGEMAAGIAHEIRNPLASMSGSIQLLQRELSLRDDHATLLDIVMRESQRLNDIIRNFLAYAGPQRVTRTRVDVARLVREVAALLRQQTDGPAVDVRLDVPERADHDLDQAQMRQVLWNLTSNARKAMPDGGVLHLSVAQAVGTTGTPTLRISVRDEGVGMAAADVERMFQPFQSGFRQGSGLGLAIVRRIVTDHGGRVMVSSTPGVGTDVVVSLPSPVARPTAVPERLSA
ncbi:MAG TPA: ATP-binding protein [Luteitalea sp.]|nr:ATP-binding protein [Luteitalea sp.]